MAGRPNDPRDKRIIGARLNKLDFEAFQAAKAAYARSRSSIVREAVQRWLSDNWGPEHREGHALPSPAPSPTHVMAAPIQPRTKAVYRGDGTAVRPEEGRMLGKARQAGALLAPTRSVKTSEPE